MYRPYINLGRQTNNIQYKSKHDIGSNWPLKIHIIIQYLYRIKIRCVSVCGGVGVRVKQLVYT